MARKMLPIGIESFEDMRRNNYYYVDKTLLIRDLLDNLAKVSLYTRPRRFGKTLTLSMIQAFFEKTGKDNSDLFRGLDIERAGEAYWVHHGRYPVLSISLKAAQGKSFEDAKESLAAIISEEALRHRELSDSSNLDESEHDQYRRICMRTSTASELGFSLRSLCVMLEKHHGEKVVLLIDEYDVPLDRAFIDGYYRDMVSLMRNLLGNALKTNASMRDRLPAHFPREHIYGTE